MVEQRDLATTYSLATLTIVLEILEPAKKPSVRLWRLHLKGCKFMAHPFDNKGLSLRIVDQLHRIQARQPSLNVPSNVPKIGKVSDPNSITYMEPW